MLQAEITSLVLQTALKGRAERLSLTSSTGRCKSQGMTQVGCYLPVRCEHHWSPLLDYTQSTVPQEATCFGIHPCCRLILQKVYKKQIIFLLLLHSDEKYLIFEMTCPFLIMKTLKISKFDYFLKWQSNLCTGFLSSLHFNTLFYFSRKILMSKGCGLTRNTTGGPPMRAMAVESLRLFPPL